MIELRNVRKTFENVNAVDGVSFQANKGEIFGLIGPNGAGKSTIIRMIMNILGPDDGEILFDGRRISFKDMDSIGYLPEERGLYKKVTVKDMLTYLAELKGVPSSESLPRMDRWLKKFKLTEWKDRKLEELSKGMSQKVQFIGAVLHNPDLVFLDEPFSGLDPVSTEVLKDAIVELREAGKTILFSTHIMDQAEKLCNQIFLINKGKEVVSGRVDRIKQKYGKNAVSIEYDGDAKTIQKLPAVKKCIEYPRYLEVELHEGASPDEFLKEAVNQVSIQRFEKAVPSLHKIFIDLTGQTEEEAADE